MMHRRGFLAGLLACPICARAARAEGAAPHWGYGSEHGPAEWGGMDSGFKACAVGSQQSPIDLSNAIRADADHMVIAWKPETFEVVNNGHTIQLNAKFTSLLTIGKLQYGLTQFHFHAPSEHAFDGKRTAMEAHFVHAQPSGRLAVIGVLMVAGKGNKAFSQIMAVAPKAEGEAHLRAPLDPGSLLPRDRDFYRYEGSLTTPPCSEVVDWNVFTHTIEVAQADIDAFKAIFPMNARPLQPLNRRFLLRGS
jgi:carbonic anhydrase